MNGFRNMMLMHRDLNNQNTKAYAISVILCKIRLIGSSESEVEICLENAKKNYEKSASDCSFCDFLNDEYYELLKKIQENIKKVLTKNANGDRLLLLNKGSQPDIAKEKER